MNEVMQEVEERSKLAGTNKFELLIFRLGQDQSSHTREIFGINVFKVREALIMPPITPMPGAPKHVLGVEIVRLEWGRVVSAERSAVGGMVASLARLDEKEENARLALILDVETILREALPSRFKSGDEITHTPVIKIEPGSVVLYADDSSVARLQIESVLTRLGLPFVSTKTGKEAWERLKTLSHEARNAGIPLSQKVAMVLTDLEMPEMDGFTLTRHIKEDDALKGLPVIIHSSLSGSANESHARSVGADGYVAKFVPDELAREVSKILTVPART